MDKILNHMLSLKSMNKDIFHTIHIMKQYLYSIKVLQS